jgi:hypothetical protein
MKMGKMRGGAALVGLAVAGWFFWPSDPNSVCGESGVRDEVQRQIGSLTPVGKALDAMLDPKWAPAQPSQPVGSNGYIPPPTKKIERPSSAEVSGVRRGYVQLAGPSLAIAYNRDVGRVTCRVQFKLNEQVLADAANRSEAFAPAARFAGVAAGMGQLKGILGLDQSQTATYTVQPGDGWGAYAITVQPLN